MDINEFIKQVKPGAKRSQLDPFKAQIFELRGLGYANGQIRDWLATNDIKVTQESVRKFIATRESAKTQLISKEKSGGSRPRDQGNSQELFESPPAQSGAYDTVEPVAAAAGLSPKQRREQRADEFIKPENTVLNLIVKKKDP